MVWSYRTFSDELKHGLFVPVSISDVKDIGTLASLFEVDSNYGRWTEEVSARDRCFIIGAIRFYTSIQLGGCRTGKRSVST